MISAQQRDKIMWNNYKCQTEETQRIFNQSLKYNYFITCYNCWSV